MSGVFIPGMEMPKNCCECPVNMELCKRGYKYLLAHMELYDRRADDCPLIAVPDHGRLIDADALPRFGGRGGLIHSKDVDNAPTIIPADKEDAE